MVDDRLAMTVFMASSIRSISRSPKLKTVFGLDMLPSFPTNLRYPLKYCSFEEKVNKYNSIQIFLN